MKYIFMISALASIFAVALICFFLFANGLPALFKIGVFDFLLGREWSPSDVPPLFGIFPMILGSICVTLGAIMVGLPLGIFTAVFMAHMCPKRFYYILKPAVDLLAGIPSVVYGFFGIVVLIPLVRTTFGGNGSSILTASLLLGVMILPTIISVSESSLRAVPQELYDGALALGASHERAVFGIILPAAKSGVLAAVVLGVGRAIGETMAVIMILGNAVAVPGSILDPVRTLTTNIGIEMGYASGEHRQALFATGIVLFVIIMILNASAQFITRKK